MEPSESRRTCMICMSIIGIPCFVNKREACTCNCEYTVCVDCLVQYSLNSSTVKCVICKHVYNYGCDFSDVVIDYKYAEELDSTHPTNVECPSCHAYTSNRMDVIHHMRTCADSQVQCIDVVQCNKCGQHITNTGFRKHVTTECDYALARCRVCNSKIPKNDMFDHMDMCPCELIKCTQCFEEVKRADMGAHAEECMYTYCECRGCNRLMMRLALSAHQKDECPQTVVECQYCSEGHVRSALSTHYTHCQKIPVPCTVCNAMVENQHLKAHQERCNLVVRLVDTKLKGTLDQLNALQYTITTSINDMENRIKSIYFKLGMRYT